LKHRECALRDCQARRQYRDARLLQASAVRHANVRMTLIRDRLSSRLLLMGAAQGCAWVVAASLLVACLGFASPADAHGIFAPPPLPIPRWLFMWGAAAAVILSFVALGALWTRPRLEAAGERRIATFPRVLDPLCGAVGVLAFAFLVYTGLHGSQLPADNLLPSFVFTAFWVGRSRFHQQA
jgi:hypothetical protein